MHVIDLHCDTLMLAYLHGFSRPPEELDLYEMPGSVDLKRLHQAGAMAQFFAVFLPPAPFFDRAGVPLISDQEYIQFCRAVLDSALKKHPDISSAACSAEEIRRNYAAGKVSAVFSMEDGRAVDGNLENLRQFHEMGIRAISLTWNGENCLGFPNSSDPAVMARGLTPFGKEAVRCMQELGILVDVSHLSDGGFYDVARICTRPFVATHSNCRTLAPHPRNLTDAMIRLLGEKGGVAGLNFGPEFLSRDPACKDSTAAAIAAHARHMADTCGEDCVAIGSDFDGIQGNLEIGDSAQMDRLEYALREAGFTPRQIDKLCFGNVLRVMEDAL